MTFVTKNQKAKTVAWILYERFISIFGAPAKLLSDWGDYICIGGKALFGIWHSNMQDYRPIMHNVMDN